MARGNPLPRSMICPYRSGWQTSVPSSGRLLQAFMRHHQPQHQTGFRKDVWGLQNSGAGNSVHSKILIILIQTSTPHVESPRTAMQLQMRTVQAPPPFSGGGWEGAGGARGESRITKLGFMIKLPCSCFIGNRIYSLS
ncbi:hypothetical protein BH09BAC1_BH09BAC1_23720 [soil metagenome]